jgi:hypothetical protein
MSEPGKQRNVAAGIAFLVIGLLLFVPSGLCTGVFGGGALLDLIAHPSNASDSASILLMVLVIGGPFLVAGFFLTRIGMRRLRGR